MTDAFEARLRAITQMRKLLALASGNENQNEAEAAMKAVRRLAVKHGVDPTTLKPLPREEMTPLDKARMMAARFTGNIAAAFPGIDTEDYSKYAEERKARFKERDRDERDSDETY